MGALWGVASCGEEGSAGAEGTAGPKPATSHDVPAMTCEVTTSVSDVYAAGAEVGAESPEQVMRGWAEDGVSVVIREKSDVSARGYVVEDDRGTVVSASLTRLPQGRWVADEILRCAD